MTTNTAEQTQACRARLETRFEQVEAVFEDCLTEALATLSPAGIDAWLDAARLLGKLGRGAEPMLALLEEWPSVARAVGEDELPAVMALVHRLQRSPNGRAIAPFLQTLAPVARRLHSPARNTTPAPCRKSANFDPARRTDRATTAGSRAPQAPDGKSPTPTPRWRPPP